MKSGDYGWVAHTEAPPSARYCSQMSLQYLKIEPKFAVRLRGVRHIIMIMAAIYYGRSSLFNIDQTKIDIITTDIIW